MNPYGIRSSSQTQNDSESSSDRMSQFGTARDYHEFDMQNEPYWYNEKDEDYFMTPCFEGPDFFVCQSEDKFVMTAETEIQQDDSLDLGYNYKEIQIEGNSGYMDKACLCNHSNVGDENENHTFVGHNCEVPFCKSCSGLGESCSEDPMNFSYPNLKEIHLNDINSFDLTIKVVETDISNGIDTYEERNDLELNEECQDPAVVADGEDVTDDELLKYIQEDEYEVFELRIIHRKNRFA